MAKKKKGKRGRPPKRKGLSLGLKLKPSTIISVVQVGFFVLAGLVVISFTRQGAILVRLNDFFVRELSWASLFLPFVFVSIGLFLSKLETPFSQPNVIVGFGLLFVSVATLGRAGEIGKNAWSGVSSLVTGIGAFIILVGASIVGLVVMFNTSLDQVLSLVGEGLKQVRKYLVGDKVVSGFSKPKLKVMEENVKPDKPTSTTSSPPTEALEQKLVSNVPGEEQVWKYPPLNILGEAHTGKADRGDIRGNASIIEKTLESFGVTARVVEVNLGPAVTQYAIEVALGTKLSKITALERDLALALAAPTGTIRIEAPIPGRSLVGIELPNKHPEFVHIKKMLESEEMKEADSRLTVALGLDVSGKPVVANLGRMPHMMIAGQTGSGKSVCINTFLCSLLFRASPSEVKMILVDPKRVELTSYDGIPHLLSPVIVDPEKVISALRWMMAEMDRRYKLFASAGARNIDSYNEMSGFQALPYIVFVVDELADIMLFSPVEVEDSITRIAQMSRATGIHMILATQRPSVDVITGLIKANIPARIAFAVSSQVDSRVILDTQGAEKLLGRGDMLYLPPEQAKPVRIQGAFVADGEVSALVNLLKEQGVKPQYTEEVVTMPKPGTASVDGVDEDVDDLFSEAVRVVCQYDRASASLLQRRLSIGYARAARVIDQLQAAGVVGPADGSKPREVKVRNAEEFLVNKVG